MDVERFMDFIAAKDSISYSNSSDGVNDYNTLRIVYATIKGNTIVIAGTDAEIEIDIPCIKEIKHIETDNMIKIIHDSGELYITYSPGDN